MMPDRFIINSKCGWTVQERTVHPHFVNIRFLTERIGPVKLMEKQSTFQKECGMGEFLLPD